MEELLMYVTKWKKLIQAGYLLHNSKYMTLWKKNIAIETVKRSVVKRV